MCNCNPRELARDFCNAIDSGFVPHDHNDKYYTKEQILQMFADYELPESELGEGLYKDSNKKINAGFDADSLNVGVLKGHFTKAGGFGYMELETDPLNVKTNSIAFTDNQVYIQVNSVEGTLIEGSNISLTKDSIILSGHNDLTRLTLGENIINVKGLLRTDVNNLTELSYFDGNTLVNKNYTDSRETLIAINESNGIGYRIKGFDTEYFGNIGLGAVDFSNKYAVPETIPIPIGNMGATGRYAFAAGGANSASGNQATAIGIGNVASGASTLVGGQGSTASGSRSTAIGDTNRSTALNSISIGGYNNSANGIVSGSFAGEGNTVGGSQSVIVGGLRNTTTGIAGFIAGSQDSNANSNGSSIISSIKVTTTNGTSSIIASQNSTTNGSISSIIAADVCEIGFPMYYSSIMAAKGSKILREPGTGGGYCQAIIASTDATINAGQPGNSGVVKWNNAIIASFYSRINAGMSYNLTTGQGTIGTASAQLVCGMYNEDEVHLSVNNPKKKAFIVGGGGNSPLTGGTPAPEWDRKTVFYVQHNGDVYADGRIETAAGVILRSPNGTKRLVTIDDDGVLQTSVI